MTNALANTPVICYGEVLWDVLPSGAQPGGAPLNVAYHLQKLGVKTAIMSRIGADEDGNKIAALIGNWGISKALIQVDEHYATSRVIATLNDVNEVSYEIVFPVAWDFIAEDREAINSITPSTYLVYGSLASRNDVSRNTLYQLLDSDAVKVFDINLRPPFIGQETLRRLLYEADIVKFNQAELEMVRALFGGPVENEASQVAFVMGTFGLSGVIVTKGASGASYYTVNEAHHAPGKAVEVNDTIGSGDAFLAAFVAGLYHCVSPEENLSNAIAMGAFVATRKGGCPDYQQAEYHRFKQHLYNQSINIY